MAVGVDESKEREPLVVGPISACVSDPRKWEIREVIELTADLMQMSVMTCCKKYRGRHSCRAAGQGVFHPRDGSDLMPDLASETFSIKKHTFNPVHLHHTRSLGLWKHTEQSPPHPSFKVLYGAFDTPTPERESPFLVQVKTHR